MDNLGTILKSLLAVTFVGLLCVPSCTKSVKPEPTTLLMEATSATVVLPPYSQTGIAFSGTCQSRFNVDSFIKASTKGVRSLKNMTSAKIASCELTIENAGDAANFANFKACSGAFHTNGVSDDFGVAVSNNPDQYASSLSLPIDTTEELKSYLQDANTFTYRFRGSLRRPTSDSIRCKITFRFNVALN